MVATVLIFALVTALFEAAILIEFVSLKLMRHRWLKFIVHLIVFGVNLWVHFGTITGTMTAVTAALVSFVVYPIILWAKTFIEEFKQQQRRNLTTV